ncbi:MAG: bacterioferritin [Myxococcales bacterium]|nr:bacterioferritin [Myxococcales bacterium]
MKGDPQIIDLLNDVLTAELTAVNQYWLHGRICQNWGYERLWAKYRHESIEEMQHADELIQRVLYFDAIPNVQRYNKVNVGESVEEMFRLDLKLEYTAVDFLNQGIKVCRERDDGGSRYLLEKILRAEEEHIDWLEAQQAQIQQMGIANYLSQQVKKDDD